MDETLKALLRGMFILSQENDQLRARVQELEARERTRAQDADAHEIAAYVSGGPSRTEQ